MIHHVKNLITYSDEHTCRRTRMFLVAELTGLAAGLGVLSLVAIYLYSVNLPTPSTPFREGEAYYIKGNVEFNIHETTPYEKVNIDKIAKEQLTPEEYQHYQEHQERTSEQKTQDGLDKMRAVPPQVDAAIPHQ